MTQQFIRPDHARNIASSIWSAPCRNRQRHNRKITSVKTTRPGAWFFEGTSGSGFVIDARCLTPAQATALKEHVQPHIATEFRDTQTGEITLFVNPLRRTARSISYRMAWSRQEVEIFTLDMKRHACLAPIFCDITLKRGWAEDPMETFKARLAPSNHALIRAQAAQDGIITVPGRRKDSLAFAA